MKKKTKHVLAAASLTIATAALMTGCKEESATTGITPQKMADALHLVMNSDRTVYTRNVVNRLVKQEKVIAASEHWVDDKALPLPAQMFRMGAEMVAKDANAGFSYSLQSLWPINKQNAPKTDAEKIGLQFIADNPGQNYYAEEELGGQKYFTGVYPDTGSAPACVDCHNEHKDSPRKDFKLGEVMGGVVIRIPID